MGLWGRAPILDPIDLQMTKKYKYIVYATPRSMSFWLAEHLGFDHDASADFALRRWEPKSEGLVDTGLAFGSSANARAAMLEKEAIAIGLVRHEGCSSSMEKTFGMPRHRAMAVCLESCRQVVSRTCKRRILQFPLSIEDVQYARNLFGLPKITNEQILAELAIKRDKAFNSQYIEQCKLHADSK